MLWLGSGDGIEEMTVPRLMACGAHLDNVIEIQGAVQQGKRNTFSMQDDLEAVGQWLAHVRADGKPFAMLVTSTPSPATCPARSCARWTRWI